LVVGVAVVGDAVGKLVGGIVGIDDGDLVIRVGFVVGLIVGDTVGFFVGFADGAIVGGPNEIGADKHSSAFPIQLNDRVNAVYVT